MIGGRCSDGNGLILNVGPTANKNWVLRVQINGRRGDIGLGSVENVSLREAREAVAENARWRARASIRSRRATMPSPSGSSQRSRKHQSGCTPNTKGAAQGPALSHGGI
ncbi:Arm DNA-binding domain-containing protein [Sphingopyxis sp. MG]|uniref:Arm DNA-binding domain-containing protein n=1 Tax=Sphingopyxis sp. MG TaxID=1866325 RepID=UPI003FA38EAB